MQAIETKYLAPTDRRGARVKATCAAGTITVAWNSELSDDGNHDAAAVALIRSLGWDYPGEAWYRGTCKGATGNVYVGAEEHSRLRLS